jgi:hypothetical protein
VLADGCWLHLQTLNGVQHTEVAGSRPVPWSARQTATTAVGSLLALYLGTINAAAYFIRCRVRLERGLWLPPNKEVILRIIADF